MLLSCLFFMLWIEIPETMALQMKMENSQDPLLMMFFDFDKLSPRNIYVLGVLSAILSGICLQMTHITRRSGVYYNYSESVITFIPLFISFGVSFALFTLSYNYKPEGSENRFI